MMEEEDDDLYAPEDSLAKAAPSMSADVKNEEMEDAEEEDEDSDSVRFARPQRRAYRAQG